MVKWKRKEKKRKIFQKGMEKKTGGFAFCFPREYILENDTIVRRMINKYFYFLSLSGI